MAANPWWVVWYEPLATRAPGTANSRYVIVQAASKSDITVSSVGGAITKVDGPFTTKAEAQADAGQGPVPGTGVQTNVQTSGGADVNLNLKNPLAAIGDFFQRLTQANTWIRVGEVLLGLILIGVGVARITGAQNIVSTAVKARI